MKENPCSILADLCTKIYLTCAAQARPSPQTPRYSSISRHCWLDRCWQWVFTCISYSYSTAMFTWKSNKELVQVRLCVVCMCTHGWKNFKRHIQWVQAECTIWSWKVRVYYRNSWSNYLLRLIDIMTPEFDGTCWGNIILAISS